MFDAHVEFSTIKSFQDPLLSPFSKSQISSRLAVMISPERCDIVKNLKTNRQFQMSVKWLRARRFIE
jgi:hypothetical protein